MDSAVRRGLVFLLSFPRFTPTTIRPQKRKRAAIAALHLLAYKYRIARSRGNCAMFWKFILCWVSGLAGIGCAEGLDKVINRKRPEGGPARLLRLCQYPVNKSLYRCFHFLQLI